MTDWNIATPETQPLNRTGVANCQVTGSDVQGTPVGIDNTGTEPKLVEADAATGTAIPALGVLLPQEVVDEATIPTGSYLQDVEEQLVQEYRTLDGDRVTVVFYGVEMVNDDDDTSWTPQDTVYLAEGGGFTTTAPSDTGDIVQPMGIVLTPQATSQGADRFYLDVDLYNHTTA